MWKYFMKLGMTRNCGYEHNRVKNIWKALIAAEEELRGDKPITNRPTEYLSPIIANWQCVLKVIVIKK